MQRCYKNWLINLKSLINQNDFNLCTSNGTIQKSLYTRGVARKFKGSHESFTKNWILWGDEVESEGVMKQWTESYKPLTFSHSTSFFIHNLFKVNRRYKSYLLKGGAAAPSSLPLVTSLVCMIHFSMSDLGLSPYFMILLTFQNSTRVLYIYSFIPMCNKVSSENTLKGLCYEFF